jgi:26S proteasome regulatory subunit T2
MGNQMPKNVGKKQQNQQPKRKPPAPPVRVGRKKRVKGA